MDLTVEFLLENSVHSKTIISVSSSDLVIDAAQLMRRHKIGLVLVIDKDKLVGVLSERDLVQRWICSEQFPNEIAVGEIMTKHIEFTKTSETIFDCYKRFVSRGCRHLPVMDPLKRVVGVLSIRNVTDFVVAELRKLAKV